MLARASEGRQGLVSANLGGLLTVAAVAWPLLHHPQLGSQHKLSTAALDTHCNYCFWALNFQTGPGRGEDSRGGSSVVTLKSLMSNLNNSSTGSP